MAISLYIISIISDNRNRDITFVPLPLLSDLEQWKVGVFRFHAHEKRRIDIQSVYPQ